MPPKRSIITYDALKGNPVIKTRILHNRNDGNRYQAQYCEGSGPWVDIGDSKDTAAEARAVLNDYAQRHGLPLDADLATREAGDR